ncbi:hypothetical protein ACFL2T_03155 [Elusimicrobiota bacterium]
MTEVLIFACVGVALEVVFTAVGAFRKERNWRLMGKSYIWMFPIYALAYPIMLNLYPLIGHWPFPARGALYVLLLYIIEYLSGWLIRRITGACPWDYGQARWAVSGLIRLDYFPAWFFVVMIFEQLFFRLTR